jgi:hypothetical protein
MRQNCVVCGRYDAIDDWSWRAAAAGPPASDLPRLQGEAGRERDRRGIASSPRIKPADPRNDRLLLSSRTHGLAFSRPEDKLREAISMHRAAKSPAPEVTARQ